MHRLRFSHNHHYITKMSVWFWIFGCLWTSNFFSRTSFFESGQAWNFLSVKKKKDYVVDFTRPRQAMDSFDACYRTNVGLTDTSFFQQVPHKDLQYQRSKSYSWRLIICALDFLSIHFPLVLESLDLAALSCKIFGELFYSFTSQPYAIPFKLVMAQRRTAGAVLDHYIVTCPNPVKER